MPNRKTDTEKLLVRNATLADVPAIVLLVARAYPDMGSYPADTIRGQINAYPDGVFIAALNDKVVGYCATIRLPEEKIMAPHSWREITGDGFGTTHDIDGEWLYGYEVCVDPEIRGYRIGQRFYRARRQLCEFNRLKGIVLVGRIPSYSRRRKQFPTPEAYIEAVKDRRVRDSVLGFQLRNGFEPRGIIENYSAARQEVTGLRRAACLVEPAIRCAGRTIDGAATCAAGSCPHRFRAIQAKADKLVR